MADTVGSSSRSSRPFPSLPSPARRLCYVLHPTQGGYSLSARLHLDALGRWHQLRSQGLLRHVSSRDALDEKEWLTKDRGPAQRIAHGSLLLQCASGTLSSFRFPGRRTGRHSTAGRRGLRHRIWVSSCQKSKSASTQSPPSEPLLPRSSPRRSAPLPSIPAECRHAPLARPTARTLQPARVLARITQGAHE
jgi:hypothetical protein